MPFGLFSCSDKNDLPNVDITVNMDNVVYDNGNVYVVAGDTLKVNSVAVKSNTDKNAGLTSVNYVFDYRLIGSSILPPYGMNIIMEGLPAGGHLLNMNFEILQVDKSIAQAGLEYRVVVVNDSTELPGGAVPGPVALDYTLSPSNK